ncbi:TATA-binding protein-associated factor mot1 [Coelomomyces lativittatus]|nr:TATA-binding protein-associated factor mot1 [Coelomomyces lativittatus]
MDPTWEVRHGAAVTLKAILKSQAKSLGKMAHLSDQENQDANHRYLTHLLVVVLRVLCLDRFYDFIGDTTVAPVREACAQVLGILLQHVDTSTVNQVVNAVLTMTSGLVASSSSTSTSTSTSASSSALLPIDATPTSTSTAGGGESKRKLHSKKNHTSWSLAYAACLSLKYIVAVRQDLGTPLFLQIVPVLLQGLRHSDDDLRAICASAFPPMLPTLIQSIDMDLQVQWMTAFWQCLELSDELSASTAAVLQVLATWCEHPATLHTFLHHPLCPLPQLILTLYPWFRHPSSSVRHALVRTCQSFLNAYQQHSPSQTTWWIRHELIQLVFQTWLLETLPDILATTMTFWKALITYLGSCQAVVPLFQPLVSSFLTLACSPLGQPLDPSLFFLPHPLTGLDHVMLIQDRGVLDMDVAMNGRWMAAEALGWVFSYWSKKLAPPFALLMPFFHATSAFQRQMVARIITFYATAQPASSPPWPLPEPLPMDFDQPLYLELEAFHAPIHAACLAVYQQTVPRLPPPTLGDFSLLPLYQTYDPHLATLYDQYLQVAQLTHTRVQSTLAAALVAMDQFPTRLNPLIRALTASLQHDPNPWLQRMSATTVSQFIKKNPSTPLVIEKLIRNLAVLVCSDPTTAPVLLDPPERSGIASIRWTAHPTVPAALAFESICETFKETLFTEVPSVLTLLSFPTTLSPLVIDACQLNTIVLPHLRGSSFDTFIHQQHVHLVHWLQCKEAMVVRYCAARALAISVQPRLVSTLPKVLEAILPFFHHDCLEIRQGVVELVYQLQLHIDLELVPYTVFFVIPLLGCMSDLDKEIRQVSSLCFSTLMLWLPLEAQWHQTHPSSSNNNATTMTTTTTTTNTEEENSISFGSLPPQLIKAKKEAREFISQLLDPKKSVPYHVDLKLSISLRSYQLEGINWLMFLNKYRLHGILADDMGLGKTLQTLVAMASHHSHRSPTTRSLVVCPATLTHHWATEVNTYLSHLLTPMVYTASTKHIFQSSSSMTSSLPSSFSSSDSLPQVWIISYDVLRHDIDMVSKQVFEYCVLDEGHVIRNAKTKVALACKQLQAHHRLILSGTPIQNHVIELWSLFDYLMPGFLGTESHFQLSFVKPILASKEPKSQDQVTQGEAALEKLHKQVLPFILRRMKQDVLKELPPKIIQDATCQLTPLQRTWYDQLVQKAKAAATTSSSSGAEKGEMFKSLHQLRHLCNHPYLFLQQIKDLEERAQYLSKTSLSMDQLISMEHAPKLQLLHQLLLDLCQDHVHRVLVFCQWRRMLDVIEQHVFPHLPHLTYVRMDGGTPAQDRGMKVNQFNTDPSIDVFLLTTHVGGLGLTLTGADTVIFVDHDWNPMNDLQAMDRAHRLGQQRVVHVFRLITKDTMEEDILGLQRFKLHVASQVVNQQNMGLDQMHTDQVLNLFTSASSVTAAETVHPTKPSGSESTTKGLDVFGNVSQSRTLQNEKNDDEDALLQQQYADDFNMEGYLASLS